ncbi:MAG TPA: YicC family protein [Crenotrichaceae bacterium]|nr:YicC family protein [Crenotrichaceae bacterium]
MIQSMTAFSTTSVQENNLEFSWEIRTVNQRFLDISIRIPAQLRSLETEIRQLITQYIKRGKVECFLTIQDLSQNQQSVQLNFEIISQIIAASKEITSLDPSIIPANVHDILSWPGVQQPQQIKTECLKLSLFNALEATLQKLIEMKQREGQQLSTLLQNKCKNITQQTVLARKRIPEILNETKKRIKERIIALKLEPDTERLEQEFVYLAQKMDITEELDRLDTHIIEINKNLQQSGPVGRRLDFLMQELNREANTIGSKSADIITSQISVELKVLIEQMREQVQNIE